MKCILAGSFLLTLFVSIAPLQAQTPPMEKAAQVTTVNAERKPIAKTHDFVGRVEAINRVDVRARVKGYLDQVLFKEGDLVARFLGHRYTYASSHAYTARDIGENPRYPTQGRTRPQSC